MVGQVGCPAMRDDITGSVNMEPLPVSVGGPFWGAELAEWS